MAIFIAIINQLAHKTITIVICLVFNINTNKAAGPDGIHGKILKYCASSLALPLSLIYTESFKTGMIPTE